MMSFLDDLAAAKAKVEDRVKTPPIPFPVNGSAYEVVYYRADPLAWSEITAKNPPRDGVTLDWNNGYDIAAVTRAISPEFGRVIEGGEEVELTAEQWDDLWAVIPPSSARHVEANVWHLHEKDTEDQIARAKKAFRPARASRKKSS